MKKPIPSRTAFALATALAGLALAASTAVAAPVIYESFGQTAGSISGKAGGTGLNNWAIISTASTVATTPTLAYGQLPFSGGQLSLPTGAGQTAYVTTTSALADAGRLADGATLWFSFAYSKASGGGANERSGFAFGSDYLRTNSTSGAFMNGTGNGVGVFTKDKTILSMTWNGGGAGVTGAGTSFTNFNDTVLVVGKIVWGATSGDVETLTLWSPDETSLPLDEAGLGAGFTKTMTGVDQTAFNTISMQQRNSGGAIIYDELRFGAAFADVVAVDTVTPTLLSIVDDQGGGPIGEDVSIITYSLTFDRHMDISTITDADFDYLGAATATFGTVTQISPTVIKIQLLPTTTGTVQLRIPAASVIKSLAQIDLDTTSAILDDTTITINSGATTNIAGSNRWWDGSTITGITDGVSQGGSASWDNGTTTNWDRGAGFEAPVAWDNAGGNTAVFGGSAGTVTLDGNITLDGLTVNLPTAAGSGYSIGNVGEDNTLTFTGTKTVTTTATGTGTNQDVTIRAGIAGSPTMNIAGRLANSVDTFSLRPGASVTQTIGTLNMLNTFASNKRLILGGESTGNVADAVTWSVTGNQLFLTKAGTGSWTINNDLAFSTGGNRSSRLYVEQGTLTLGGTANFFTHKVGVSTTRETTFSASGTASKLVAKGTFTIGDNREFFYVQNLGTISPGPGVETLAVRWNANNATSAANGAFNMQTGSTYEWGVASNISTDVINVTTGGSNNANLILGDITLKVTDAGAATAIANTDQLTVFTYETGAQTVLRSIGTVTFDTSALGAGWTVGTLALTDDGAGKIYLTGLSFSVGPATPYDIWSNGTFTNGTLTNKTTGGDDENDTLTNLQEYAFGTDPTVNYTGPMVYVPGGDVTTPGQPILLAEGGTYYAVFGRRKDYVAAGLTYTVEFSADLSSPWVPSVAVPTLVTGDPSSGDIAAVRVPFPGLITTDSGPQKARFFRLEVLLAP